MDEWTFDYDDYEYKINPRTIEFVGEFDGNRYVFCVLASTLNDFFETDDDKKSAIDNYLENIDNIHRSAEIVAAEDEKNEDSPHYYIGLDDLGEFC